jgi:hypothetical protein
MAATGAASIRRRAASFARYLRDRVVGLAQDTGVSLARPPSARSVSGEIHRPPARVCGTGEGPRFASACGHVGSEGTASGVRAPGVRSDGPRSGIAWSRSRLAWTRSGNGQPRSRPAGRVPAMGNRAPALPGRVPAMGNRAPALPGRVPAMGNRAPALPPRTRRSAPSSPAPVGRTWTSVRLTPSPARLEERHRRRTISSGRRGPADQLPNQAGKYNGKYCDAYLSVGDNFAVGSDERKTLLDRRDKTGCFEVKMVRGGKLLITALL